ncbi:DNA-binding PadR family transcriptional regulator [Actinoplanes lutulentus]|uniref:PadR family transcriptional regulator n=1 Tax=Actinoplanes lutulentus TaxID=1287878 RepID=A0A327Z508_9ACTN|nr:PadR family transcriptional regulator [Actinoplanes lutulentus]MBB2947837.1 DNA-binding PadR family transcriptional regulator [Actinoplanes lutulentus]RAK29850.1 PadR family transcriptional regulator [Actinoplanes lutulentus]
MTSPVRVTAAVSKVLAAFLEDPEADRYGLDLMRASGHPSGTLYPILLRLQRAGWVAAEWEQIDPVAAGRPARRYYRLTPDGLVAARTEIAALRQQLDRALGGVAKPRPA